VALRKSRQGEELVSKYYCWRSYRSKGNKEKEGRGWSLLVPEGREPNEGKTLESMVRNGVEKKEVRFKFTLMRTGVRHQRNQLGGKRKG